MKHYILLKIIVFLVSVNFLLHANSDEECARSIKRRLCGVSIDYLLWKPDQEQLQYALNIPGGFPHDGLILAPQVFIIDQEFQKSSGFRTTLSGYISNEWDLYARYTYYRNSSFSCTCENNNGVLATAVFGLLDMGGILAKKASSNWRLKFDVVDVECGYIWAATESLWLKPHCGLKWARINQHQLLEYDLNDFDIRVNRKNNFSGPGLQLGLRGDWYFYGPFSLVGNFSAAILYGKFTSEAPYDFTNAVAVSHFARFIECKRVVRPMIDLFLGLQYEKLLHCIDVEVSLGYQAQCWWNQWQVMPSGVAVVSGALANGDLLMQGLVAHVGVKF